MPENRVSKIISVILTFIALLTFIVIALSLVWSKGVCCADDAYLSTVAKNLANGLGYASSMQAFVSHYTIRPFDPTDGTGPTIILPAALFIRIFGNTYWAPGLANVTLWSLLLVLIVFFVHKKYNHGIVFLLFVSLFLYLNYALMTYHFEHWYALLGEVPSALFIMLGIICFYYRNARVNQLLTGVLFSLAVESKLLSLVAVLGFVVAYGVVYFSKRSEDWIPYLKNPFTQVFFVGSGFLIPVSLFELWKLFVLRRYNYLENWREYLGFIRDKGMHLDQFPSLVIFYGLRSDVLAGGFGIILPIVAGMLILGWLMVRKDTNLEQLYTVFSIIVIIFSAYWIFVSNGRARYFIICLILLNFTMSLPLLSSRSKIYIILYSLLLFVIPFNTWERLQYPFEGVNGQFFKPTIKTQALIEVSKALSQKKQPSNGPYIGVTQWWATAADVEYLMDMSYNFTTFRDPSLLNNKPTVFTVVVNTLFLDKNDKDFNDLIATCEEVIKIDVYMIATCVYGIN